MKIKFLKEYKFLRGFDNNIKLTTTKILKDAIVDTVEDEIPDDDVQWLIDNGFAEEVNEPSVWKPKFGETYYFLAASGEVYIDSWVNGGLDELRYSMGACFKTRAAIRRWRDYLRAIATVRQDEGVLTPEQVYELGRNAGKVYHVEYTGKPHGEEALRSSAMDLYDIWAPVGAILFSTIDYADASLNNHPGEWKIIANYDWSRE